jgi:hypothetical protein
MEILKGFREDITITLSILVYYTTSTNMIILGFLLEVAWK